MKKIAIITGGSGYIGSFLLKHLLNDASWNEIYNFDLIEQTLKNPKIIYRHVDVRSTIHEELGPLDNDKSWIFNLAALCREPGNEPHEYFDTNVNGAKTVTEWADRMGIKNIYFTSTMSTFGRMLKPTPENSPQYPETPYGISKVIAEKTHQIWYTKDTASRRLIICRPSVIFGPGDTQNIPRMIKAIKKGYFVFPGNPNIVKAYGYVLGLMDSIDFVMGRINKESQIIYHYAENPLLNLRGMAKEINIALELKRPIIQVPNFVLVGMATIIQGICSIIRIKTPLHPVRVKKVAYSTHLEPRYLMEKGFEFKYQFDKALKHLKICK